MNERVAAAGNQIKEAFNKLKNAWIELEATRKRMIIIVVAAIIVAAIVLAAVLNGVSGRYIVLYGGLPREESVAGLAQLETAGITGRINNNDELEVPANRENAAMGQLAMVGIPGAQTNLELFEKAGGLTMTDFEKRQYEKYQSEATLSDTIKTFDGVRDAFVNIHRDDSSNRVWNASNANNTASVKVTMETGTVLSASQITGIRNLVGNAAGIEPEKVAVLDTAGNTLAASGDSYSDYDAASQFVQRQGLQEDVEAKLHDKAANVLSMAYPDANDYRITPTVELDWDAMITESVEYIPLEGTQHGVAEHEEEQALMGTGQFAEGVVGETDNTDVPVYADLDGDGEWDAVDYYRSRDFLVSYIKQQIEKDGAKMANASMSVIVAGNITNDVRQMYRDQIAQATNIPVEDISVNGVPVNTIEEPPTENVGTIIPFIPDLYVYIALLAIVALIAALIVITILRRRAKKKRLAAEAAALEAEEAEALRIQQEIEERKRLLKDAAMADSGEDVIIDEVRDFARQNPEITANLLRNWLKEGD